MLIGDRVSVTKENKSLIGEVVHINSRHFTIRTKNYSVSYLHIDITTNFIQVQILP